MIHFYKAIPGSCPFRDYYIKRVKEAPKDKPSIFVEIGCWKGRSAALMAVEIINSKKPIGFYTVDHFKGSPNHQEGQPKADPDVIAGTLEAVARKNLKSVAHVANIIPLSSVEAAGQFEDGTVDFLFIDGTHDYDNVKADLTAWLPKMKRPGGIIGGDDANWTGVKEAAIEMLGGIEVIEPHRKGRYWIGKTLE